MHIQRQLMACKATMKGLARRWAICGALWPEECPICKSQGRTVQDTRIHALPCLGTRVFV